MEKEELEIIRKRIEKLTRMELAYMREWMMNRYDIISMDHHISSIPITLDTVDAEFKEIDNFLNEVKNHSKWEVDESVFIEAEKKGTFIEWDTDSLMARLSDEEWGIFYNRLKSKYPKYEEMHDWSYNKISDSFGVNGFSSWEEAYNILKDIYGSR